jgi:hypothetical protein
MADDMFGGAARFGLDEVVELRVTPKTRTQAIAGRQGVVTGIARPENPSEPVTGPCLARDLGAVSRCG